MEEASGALYQLGKVSRSLNAGTNGGKSLVDTIKYRRYMSSTLVWAYVLVLDVDSGVVLDPLLDTTMSALSSAEDRNEIWWPLLGLIEANFWALNYNLFGKPRAKKDLLEWLNCVRQSKKIEGNHADASKEFQPLQKMFHQVIVNTGFHIRDYVMADFAEDKRWKMDL